MKKIIIALSLVLSIISGCKDPKEELLQETPITYEANSMTFLFNRMDTAVSVFNSKTNGYNNEEVVFITYAPILHNALMLTFKPVKSGYVIINKEMTGYWDLGLCIPFNKYLLNNKNTDFLRIDYYDANTGIIKGEFNLTFYAEKNSDIATFTNGKFIAKIDSKYPFKYCVEG